MESGRRAAEKRRTQGRQRGQVGDYRKKRGGGSWNFSFCMRRDIIVVLKLNRLPKSGDKKLLRSR
ncbi:MAG: hypothetical protein LBQ58_10670 [Synergistaceae bacterium]|nr:hypothetical protein [Synergistaceae bacterium]